MSKKEFEDYLYYCKRDLTKSFNISKKFYMLKFGDDDETLRIFDEKAKEYL